MAAAPILVPLGRSTYWTSSLTYLAQRDAKRATRGAPSKFEGGTSAQMTAKEWPLGTPFRTTAGLFAPAGSANPTVPSNSGRRVDPPQMEAP